ncbi:MAG: thioredoxin-dependent thiol peroxidase [Candidatus Methanofastidiosum methylothiophilum]|jgi:peroxiredoxin Q/BCP|uniref:Thioredoxin-dependent thiol peroxidase n=1 Tax=Candidatus Methanofastidiosum methylothiophilum TaxID=1705564 RepID=A0A150J585_9EURY|nr:MAG: thioredoxin-dependent thiol peroxidase [Candidatus Methanofastidiosum methylthiophilus]
MPYEKHLEGEQAINFCLNDKKQDKICLNNFRGKWKVIFFFDKNSLESPNSDIIYYSKVRDEFKDLNAELIGIGPVSEKEIDKFCAEHDINIILLSDVDYKISGEYGVILFDKEKKKKILPMTFLINKDDVISRVWNREKMYYRFSGYGGNAIDLWEQGKMWAHISIVTDYIEFFDKKKN